MAHLDQRRAELLRRRLTGEDFTAIARELDYADAAEAAADFADALAATDPLEPLARHEADQRSLDELQHAIWDLATTGDLDAISTALAISDSRSRRLGLDAPARLESAGPAVDPAAVTAAELDELLALIEDPPI
ncbi:hypothetical protein HUT19_41930 (plasmid) [Streptomyces sp. NA02950]|uniref:hypothetical protein n=1 Tax=Streptomyces sp. NA02950 TaxID=2742137 RepID=UPI0015927DC7|nr:hypothetical protein [Streptomyces sp. NA02950]QKV98279.1 hypothetical protein HUT19_41930 [Streptomyces sp. NA02950]